MKEQVTWAKGRKQSEVSKYTSWCSPSPYCKLGGFTIDSFGSHTVAVVPHSSDGECYSRYFDIPVDKVEDFCHALMKVKNLADKSKEE